MISKFLNSLINNPLLYPGSRYHQYIWLHPITKTPTLGFMRFTILVDPSMVIITEYSVCLIYMYAWEIFKAIIHFTMWLKWQRLSTGTSAQEIMKCTILVDFFLVIITLYSVFHICSHIYILPSRQNWLDKRYIDVSFWRQIYVGFWLKMKVF